MTATKLAIIHLRSGQSIEARFTGEVSTEVSTSAGKLTSWKITGITSHTLLTIPPQNISAIEVRK